MSCSYDVQYLGCAMLTRPMTTTGLGMLQRPLIDLYGASFEPKTGEPRALPLRRLTLTERGLIITAIDDAANQEEQDTFYAMSSVVFWEAVRFVTVKLGDKKYRGAFEPTGERQLAKENMYTDLDKQCRHLAKHVKQHPVLAVLVLRRTTGVKALELQAFACSSSRQGACLVEDLGAAHFSYGAQQANSSSGFGYNAFDRDGLASVSGDAQVISAVSAASGNRLPDDRRRHAGGTVSAAALPAPQGSRDSRARTAVSRQDAEVAAYTQSCFNLSAAGNGIPRQNATVGPRQLVQNDLMTVSGGLDAISEDFEQAGPSGAAVYAGPSGGAIEGYYDMPRAIRLPIVGSSGPPTSSSSGTTRRQQQEALSVSHQQLGRSQTFREPPTQSSVLHRPLIQQSAGDDNALRATASTGAGVKSSRSPAYFDCGINQRLASGADELKSTSTPDSAAGGKRVGRSQTFYQPPSSDRQTQLHRQLDYQQPQKSGGNTRSQPKQDDPAASVPFDFMFGFDVSPPQPADKIRQQPIKQNQQQRKPQDGSGGDAVKPTATVQPRKVAGVRVFPDMHSGALKSPLQQQQQQSKTTSAQDYQPAPAADVAPWLKQQKQVRPIDSQPPTSSSAPITVQSRAVAPVSSAEPTITRPPDAKNSGDGILNLRTVRGSKYNVGTSVAAPSTKLITDINFNEMKVQNNSAAAAPNRPSLDQLPTSRAANNFELLRAASAATSGNGGVSSSSAAERSWDVRRGEADQTAAAGVPLKRGPMIVDGGEDVSAKDREIASAIGGMKVDYQPSTGTLLAPGTNFEQYLGYLP